MKYLGTVSDSADLTNKKYVDGEVSGVSTSLTNHIDDTDNPHGVTKSQLGLSNVENKSSATIRGELTKDNVTTALGYTPPTTNTTYTVGTTTYSGTTKLYTSTGTAADGTMTQKAITNAIPSLSGYATVSWVESKGYLTSAPVTSVIAKQVQLRLHIAMWGLCQVRLQFRLKQASLLMIADISLRLIFPTSVR